MIRDTSKFTQAPYDLLVVGGGINGAAVAHIAALNGLKTALLEKGDFAGGTSGKSTKLMHGGLRYLENLEFGLVREALQERSVQLKSSPHLVHPLKFIIPVYKTDKRPLWKVKLGVWLYDFLSREDKIEPHRPLTAAEVCRAVPGIRKEGLVGGVMYSDAQMNDARLCLENILSAAAKGADVANYVKVRSLIQENGRAVGAQAYDELGQKVFNVRAKKIVCAVGPWTNSFTQKEDVRPPFFVRTTKGIHIVYRGRVSNHAVLVPAQRDGRVFFIIPWLGHSLIGTTDTDFTDYPDNAAVKKEDVDYLIREAGRVLPDMDFRQENIITTFAGLRPLVSKPGAPSRVSRGHVVKESSSGLIYVMGGKYTMYRKIAEDVVRRVARKPLVDTRKLFPVYGSGTPAGEPAAVARQYNVELDLVRALMDFYGTRYGDVLKLTEEDAALKEPICACSPVIRAQVVYAVRTEMARTPEDIITRRLTLGYTGCADGRCRREIQQLLGQFVEP
jgi:glycerol-3-phosphate dehydrogenase